MQRVGVRLARPAVAHPQAHSFEVREVVFHHPHRRYFAKRPVRHRDPPLEKWYKKTSPPHAETHPCGIPLALTQKRDRGGSPKKRGGSRSPGRSRTVSARRQTPPRVS